jgi:hypothetical protein
MAENPIKKEDIIDAKGILESIASIVDAIKNQLVPAMDLIVKKTTEQKAALEKLNPAQKEDQAIIAEKSQAVQQLDTEQKKNKQTLTEIEQLQKKLAKAMSEEALESERLRQEIGEQNKANRDLIASEKIAKGSLTDLRKQLSEMKKLYADASPNKRGGMIEGIQKLDKEVSKLEKTMGVHQRNVGNYAGALKNLGTKFMALTGVTAGFAGAMKLGKEVIESTDALGDKFSFTLAGWKSGFDAIKRSIATNDFKDFGNKVKDAINEGKRYAEGLDTIDEKTRALKIAESEAGNELLKQMEISRSSKYTKDQQIAAGKKIIEIEETLTKIRTGISEQAYKNEIKNISKITGLTEDEVLSFAKQDSQMVANIENGKEYNNLVSERNKIYRTVGQLTNEQSKRYEDLNKQISGASEETKKFAFAQLNMPGDEKMQLLVDKYVEYQQAIGSGLQNTMRTRVRMANAEEKLSEETSKTILTQEDKDQIAGMKHYVELTKQREEERKQIVSDASKETSFIVEGNLNVLADKQKALNNSQLSGFQLLQRNMVDVNKQAGEQMTEANKKVAEDKKKADEKSAEDTIAIEEAKRQAISDIAMGALDFASTLIETQKQKELEAAGDNAEKKAKIEKEYAKKEKAMALGKAVIMGALAIMNAMNTQPFLPLGPIMAGVASAMASIQVSIIAATKFAEGGEVGGKLHSQGGTLIEAEKDEFIVKRKSASKYKGLLKAINDDDPMRIAEELRNNKFHTVWGGVQQTLSNVSKQDPYTRLMYEELRNKPFSYSDSDGNTVIIQNNIKRVIKKR